MLDYRRITILSLVAFIALAAQVSVFAAPGYKDGSYTATYSENGMGSLTVTVAIRDGAIASIDFPEGTGDVDMAEDTFSAYLKTLRDAPALMEVDAISGATASCNLLKSAICEALLAASKD